MLIFLLINLKTKIHKKKNHSGFLMRHLLFYYFREKDTFDLANFYSEKVSFKKKLKSNQNNLNLNGEVF